MKLKIALGGLLLRACLLALLSFPSWARTDNKTQLENLVAALEAKRMEYHIPGMAIAIVKDGEVILSQGFGTKDLQTKDPVSTDTLFAIGSTTKALTATLIGTLVDSGALNWDDEISQYLPEYHFQYQGKKVPLTFRDALSHRSGYSRNDLLWANSQASRDLILKTAIQAEPMDEFRKSFHYNNVMYLAAGLAAAKVKGMSWDAWIEKQLFQPLKMMNSSSRYEVAIQSSKLSEGYIWNEETQSHIPLPRRNINNVAPAGGVFSNADDMAHWLKLLLNKGRWEGQPLISSMQLNETWSPQIQIAANRDYAMGWFLQRWKGQKVIEHGGSIDGYAAQVALLPESKLGFVLLTNVTATPLQQESMSLVWKHLAESNDSKTETLSSENLQVYTGKYHANFASFKNELFSVSINDQGKLAVDVPGQMNYELLAPDEKGRWYFAMTDTVSVSFEKNDQGQVTTLRMHQGGMNFELPRQGVTIEPEIDPQQLQAFLGQYESKVFNGVIDVILQNHRLTLDIPNEMAFELHLPDHEGQRQFRIKDNMSVKFNTNDLDEVTELVLFRDRERVVDTAVKLGSSQKLEALPTLQQVMALSQPSNRSKALIEGKNFRLTGTVRVVNSGVQGQVTTSFDAESHLKQHMDFGVFGEVIVVTHADKGATWGINPYTELQGKYLKQAQNEHPAVMMNWLDQYDKARLVGRRSLDDKEAYVVQLKDAELPSVTIMVDTSNGDILQYKTRLLNRVAGAMPVKVEYSDYRNVEGLRIPFETTIHNPMMGRLVIRYDSLQAKVEFEEGEFDITKGK